MTSWSPDVLRNAASAFLCGQVACFGGTVGNVFFSFDSRECLYSNYLWIFWDKAWGLGVIIFIMQFAILRVFCTSLHATPQALGCLLGTTNNMGTKNMIKKQCSSTRLMSPVRAKVEINFKFKLLYLPSGGDRPSDRRRDTVDWRKPPENNFKITRILQI